MEEKKNKFNINNDSLRKDNFLSNFYRRYSKNKYNTNFEINEIVVIILN